ncbi:MAG: hypothetical protein V1800_09960, partial [Candidatus Latescibacterota bacterium]
MEDSGIHSFRDPSVRDIRIPDLQKGVFMNNRDEIEQGGPISMYALNISHRGYVFGVSGDRLSVL